MDDVDFFVVDFFVQFRFVFDVDDGFFVCKGVGCDLCWFREVVFVNGVHG